MKTKHVKKKKKKTWVSDLVRPRHRRSKGNIEMIISVGSKILTLGWNLNWRIYIKLLGPPSTKFIFEIMVQHKRD